MIFFVILSVKTAWISPPMTRWRHRTKFKFLPAKIKDLRWFGGQRSRMLIAQSLCFRPIAQQVSIIHIGIECREIRIWRPHLKPSITHLGPFLKSRESIDGKANLCDPFVETSSAYQCFRITKAVTTFDIATYSLNLSSLSSRSLSLPTCHQITGFGRIHSNRMCFENISSPLEYFRFVDE